MTTEQKYVLLALSLVGATTLAGCGGGGGAPPPPPPPTWHLSSTTVTIEDHANELAYFGTFKTVVSHTKTRTSQNGVPGVLVKSTSDMYRRQ